MVLAWACDARLENCGRSACREPGAPGGNILVLVLDDVGTDKLGASPWAPRTPNIDALAARGVRFRNAYAAPSCSPSRAAMLTGRHPRRYGLGGRIRSRSEPYELPLSELTLPEMLERSPIRYQNAALGKWHLSSHRSPSGLSHPLDSGFSWFAGSVANLQVTDTPGVRGSYFRWQKNTNGSRAFTETYATTDTVDDAIARIEAMNPPWFLWVGFNAAHTPLHTPPGELTGDARPTTNRGRFDAAITALDSEVGRLLAAVDPVVLADTTILLVGDNGTPGDLATPGVAADPGGRAHRSGKGSLSEAGIRVPLIVAGPHVRQPGTPSDALVHVVDIFATAAELAGVDLGALRDQRGRPLPIDGQSLLRYARNPGAASRRSVLYQDRFAPNGPGPYQSDARMVRDGRYKLLQGPNGRVQLFDLANAEAAAGGRGPP